MTADARALIEEYLALPDAAKREVLAELVRVSDFAALAGDELTAAADQIFLAYDEREAAD
jgi:hypothetical protein